jgi:hypothetical protein
MSVSRRVSDLLGERVDSFDKLSILMLLRAERNRAWNPETVAERLNIPPRTVAEALDALCAGGLLDVRIGSTLLFRYNPVDAELAAGVEELVSLYQRDPSVVVSTITARAIDRARHSSARAFADAFLIRPDHTSKKR